jgi:ankyrin repeat protein
MALTSLQIAMEPNAASICPALLENGADVNAEGKDQNTPLHLAVLIDSCEAVETLFA